jgi:hypothetical protein
MWHDWALFQWNGEETNYFLIPGHIVTFVEFDEFQIGLLEDNQHVIASGPGLYAMIESIEDPLAQSDKYTRIVVEDSKNLTAGQHDRRRSLGMPLNQGNTLLVHVDTIYEPIAAVPNLGAADGDYLFIRPADDWGFEFTKLLSPFLPPITVPAT